MHRKVALRLVVVALLGLAGGAGCSFWGFSGSGPVDKDTAYRLYGRAPWKVSETGYKEAFDASFQMVPWSVVQKESAEVATNRATFRQSSRRYWGTMLIIGYTEAESRLMLDKGADKTERLFGRSWAWLPVFPAPVFWLSTYDMWHSLDRGEELSLRFSHGLGPAGIVAGYTQCVQPADILQANGNTLVASSDTFGQHLAAVVATKGEDARYNSQWGWHILGGVIAWGRVNYEYFIQVVWIPIPLWRVRE